MQRAIRVPSREELLAWLARALRRHGLRLALTGFLATLAVRGVLKATGGEPAVPLDDAFIHFQYARSFWEGRGLSYTVGAPPAAGATSLLWPLALSVPYALGLRGLSIVWAAWLFGWCALAFLGYETRRASERLLSGDGALAAEVMVLCFGGHVWFASSGMEVVPLAWLLMRTARVCAEWVEGPRVPQRPTELLVLAALGPLLRPEGLLGTLLVVGTLAGCGRGRARAWGFAAALGGALPALVNLVLAGTATTTTAAVKWLPSSPYLDRHELFATIGENVRVLYATLLDGKIWSAVFLPEGSRFVLWPAVPALLVAGVVRKAKARAVLVALVALGMLLPTSYDSFLWNRLRYLWPFAAAWFVGVAALADGVGELARRLDPALVRVRLLASGAVVGALVSHLGWTLDDLATSANAIRSQQVALGRWAHDALPNSAVIGVNDTGAIAYFSERRTFDVVGLTTRGEAPYWVAGTGSRFEHYERLGKARLPSHFIVYPEWFGLPALLGTRETEQSVPGATILGGETMVAHVASYDALGSAALPADPSYARCTLLDELDVADLESERAHDYALFEATQAQDVALSDDTRVDGGREGRSRERFVSKQAPGGRFVARLESDQPTTIELAVAGETVGSLALEADGWRELAFTLPTGLSPGSKTTTLVAKPAAFAALHYWSYRCP